MISSQYSSFPFQQWYPATDLKSLSALVNYHQVKLPFGQVFSENPVRRSNVSSTNHISLI
jgi:hypothetical protein